MRKYTGSVIMSLVVTCLTILCIIMASDNYRLNKLVYKLEIKNIVYKSFCGKECKFLDEKWFYLHQPKSKKKELE